jgi:hypothetical protein
MASADRRQIGLTEAAQATVGLLTDELGWFAEGQEAGRFALAYAVRNGTQPSQTTSAVDTRWSPDGFDPTGEIRSLLRAVYPENTAPIRLMEYLIDEGLRGIRAELGDGSESPLDLLG